MKYIVLSGNDLIGMCGHITNDISNDFDKYILRYGFNDTESAREVAECLGLTDAEIVAIKCAAC